MNFKIKKIPLTEEKRPHATFYVEETSVNIDIEAFVKREIFDEYVDFKCPNCKNEEELEADILFELFFRNLKNIRY